MQGHPRWTVLVKNSDTAWFTGGGNSKLLQYSCRENPMNNMKRQKYMTLEDEPLRLEGNQYATGEEWRALTNINRATKNEVTRPKQKQHSVVYVTGGESKV